MSSGAGGDTVDIETSSPPVPSGDLPRHTPAATAPSDWRSWLIPVATVLGFAIPAVAYLWMIHSGSVNIVFADQWDDVALIGRAHSGTLNFSTLWTQHYENRIFFPNLIVLALAYTTHFNVVTEEYLSALMLFGGTALVICAHKLRSPGRRWIWYCPVAFLMLSLAQAVNALWGFQMAWYLVLFMITLALFLLDREPQRWLIFGGAIAAAVVASFSSLQGLLVWPAGLLLIYLRRRPGRFVVAWISSAVLAGAIYSLGFDFNASQSGTRGPSSVSAVLTFFVRVVGDIVGEAHPGFLVTLLGVVLAVTAIWALVWFAIHERATTGGRPFALSLIFFGLLFSALTASGRSGLSVSGFEVVNRYTVFAIFVIVGLYLAVLDPIASELPPVQDARPQKKKATEEGHVFSAALFTLARTAVGVGIVLTVIVGSANGIAKARDVHDNGVYLGQVTVRADTYPNPVVATLDWLETPQSVRHWIHVAKDDHLSLFGTSDATRYLSERPLDLHGSPIRAAMILPHDGSNVHGSSILDAVVSDVFDVKKVDFVLNGPDRSALQLGTGKKTGVGWLSRWSSATVPNGNYTIQATVSDSGGRTFTTTPIRVRVQN